MPHFQLRIVVHGETVFDHAWITRVVGLTSTSTSQRGDEFGGGRSVAKYSNWVHTFPAFEAWEIRTAVASAADFLGARAADLAVLSTHGLQLQLRVVGVLGADGESLPDLGLDASTIANLARAGAELDIDLYEHGVRDLFDNRYPPI